MSKPPTHRLAYDNIAAPTVLCVSIPEAGRLLGIGRSSVYELVGDGELELVKFGRRAVVPYEALKALVAKKVAQNAAEFAAHRASLEQ